MSTYPIYAFGRNHSAAVPSYPAGGASGSVAVQPHVPPPRFFDAAGESMAWAVRAGELSEWALAYAVARTDAFIAYQPALTADGLVAEPRTRHETLTRDRLVRHFGGDPWGARIAVHLVGPGDETCKLTVVDIDAHGPDDDPEANWAFAREVARRAASRGAVARVFDSNGAGGYHIWVFHPRPGAAAESYLFGRWLIRDWRAYVPRAPESMPKSPSLTGKGFGSSIRLPGRHPRRAHWTAVWDGVTDDRIAGFLRGTAAVVAILETRGLAEPGPADPLVPLDFVLPTNVSSPAAPARVLDPDGLDREAARARDALSYLGPGYFEFYDAWLEIGMALRQLGDQGLALWHEWSAQSPSLYEPEVLDRKWRTFAPPADESLAWPGQLTRRIGLGTLFAYAKQEGWMPPRRTAESMPEEAGLCRQALLACPETLAELAARMEVGEDVLHRLGVGWKPDNSRRGPDGGWVEYGPAWTFPLVSGSGDVIGILRRYLDDSIDDRVVRGSRPGLIVPAGWEEGCRPILVVEGLDDVAWLIGAGYCAIGRPSDVGGVEHLARLLRGVDRSVVVVAEDDRRLGGKWPGKERAEAVAQGLATGLGRGVKTWLPPERVGGVYGYIKLRRDRSVEA